MKFYRDLFESSLNRVFPNNENRVFQTFYDAFVHMSPETEAHFSSAGSGGSADPV